MTNKLVVIINSLKYQKLRKFTIWSEISCIKLQLPPEPLTRGLPPPDPRSLCPLSSSEFVEPPHRTKFLGTPLIGWIGERDICGHRSWWVGGSAESHLWTQECQSKIMMGEWVSGRHLWTQCKSKFMMGGGSVEETSVDTECQGKTMMGGWISGRDICGHRSWWVGGSAEETSVDTRVSIKDHDGGGSAEDICGHSANQSSWWMGGSVEETSVDTECQTKTMMGGWMSGRNICGHRSWWVGVSAEETSVDTECQAKTVMGGWISGRNICGHRSWWVGESAEETSVDNAATGWICRNLFWIFNTFSAITKQNCAKPSRNLRNSCGYHYLMCIVKTLSNLCARAKLLDDKLNLCQIF